jgi:hypothetical protein
MDTNADQFGAEKVRNPLDEDTDDTTTRDSRNSRSESDVEWERSIGARDMDIWCYWQFDSDEIEAKYDGTEGRGDTVADALADLAKELRRSD